MSYSAKSRICRSRYSRRAGWFLQNSIVFLEKSVMIYLKRSSGRLRLFCNSKSCLIKENPNIPDPAPSSTTIKGFGSGSEGCLLEYSLKKSKIKLAYELTAVRLFVI